MKMRQTYQWNLVRNLLVFSLLTFYGVGYFSFTLSHRLQHSHEYELLHTEVNEGKACHRAVFHHEKNACNHKTHLASHEEQCILCDVIVQQDRFALFIPELKHEQVVSTVHFPVQVETPGNCLLNRHSRAPPFLI